MPFRKSIVSLVLLLPGLGSQGLSQNPAVKTYGIDFSPYVEAMSQ